MKAEEGGGSASVMMTNMSNSLSMNSSSNAKYGGLIERTPLKKLIKELSFLFDYAYSVAPTYKGLYMVMNILRLLQFVGPSLCPGYSDFWTDKDNAQSTVQIFSIFYFIVPPKFAPGININICIFYIILLFLVLSVLVISAKYFQKNASLPKIIPIFVSLYFASFGHYLHNMLAELMISALGRVIFKADLKSSVAVLVILIALSVILTALYIYLYLAIASRTLIFRPESLQTVASQTSNAIFMTTTIITVLTAFVETPLVPKVATFAILLVCSFIYFGSIMFMFLYGGIINNYMMAAYSACGITGGIMCLAIGISMFLDKEGKMHYFIIFLILWVVSFVVSLLFMTRVRVSRLQLLDEILDDIGSFDRVKSVNHFVNMATEGFKIAHPICVNWKFMVMAVERWPDQQMTWFTYAKFVAIYPEETKTLWWIFRNIVTNKVHGAAARTVKEQSMSIARQREPNLSPDLKFKLNNVSKHLTSTKHKLRHVWDLAIQGNISDMESATKRAIKEIEQSDAELLHVLRQFPNNRFVTRQYARFCRELKADQHLYIEMIEKTRQLQRGMSVNKDQAHEMGLASFHNLPDKVSSAHENGLLSTIGNESATTSMMELETEDDENREADESLVLVSRIDSLTIPATRWSIIINLLLFFVVFAAPIIALLIYLNFYADDITQVLPHMFYLSMLRTYNFMLTAFSERRIYEIMGAFGSPPHVSDIELPLSVGGSWDTLPQLRYILTEVASTLQKIDNFRSFESESPWIKEAQTLVFQNVLEYNYYTNNIPEPKNISIQSAMADMILQQKDIIDENVVLPPDVLNSSTMLNPLMNIEAMASMITKALENLISFEDENNGKHQILFTTLMISVIVIVIIVFITSLVAQIMWINSNKDQVYRCLTALPKNAVSTVAENLRVLKKEAENSSSSMANTEMSKQEDAILKIFVTGGNNSSTKIVDTFLLIICTIVFVAMHIGCTISLSNMASDVSQYVRSNSPHLNYLQGSLGYMVGALVNVVMMIVNGDPDYNVIAVGKKLMVSRFETRTKMAVEYYHQARFGGSSADDPPFSAFDKGVDYAMTRVECVDRTMPSNNFLEAAKCYAPDILYLLLEGIWSSRVVPFNYSSEVSLKNEIILTDLWSLMIYPIYDGLFEPMTRSLVSTMQEDIQKILVNARPAIIAMIIVSTLFIIVDVIQILVIEKHIKSVLKLLLHIPSNVVMGTPKIMTILGGNFKRSRNDAMNRNAEFFHEVVMNLPDTVIVTDNDHKISAVNKSFTRILGFEEAEVVGKTLPEFFNGQFSGEVHEILSNVQSNRLKVNIINFKKDENELTMEATSLPIGSLQVILCRDMTQAVRYNTLITEEKNKSDVLLSSILPPSLVKRVQAGEKNISFAVQSATIVFMDIVSFTPWCGSLPADKVMSTLNNLFKKFDACANKYPTMTKIKCIGDCYMAAGGVFAEVNQPAEHAKDVVSFGLDALNSITVLNTELNEKLQIRVGINTGGPIVAGVLGIGKPTFEILGPAINMAQQMEHHGVPMAVHVSRSVYELIYGGSFVIKERGSVDVKGGAVITYLVSSKTK